MKRKQKAAPKARSSFSDLDEITEDEAYLAQKKADTTSKPKEPVTLTKVLIRSATATFFFGIYLGLLQMGHLYCIISVMLVQTELYREIVNVRYVDARERSMPLFRSLQWAWFVLAMIFVYGGTLHRFCVEHKTMNYILPITENLNFVVYGLYFSIFVASVLTLKPGIMRFQLSQHMWSLVMVGVIVFQCKFFASNMLNGLFWFVYPFIVVISNDVSAYFAGITCGRKFIQAPFLALSPNKTWEGFIGAFLATMVFSFIIPAYLAEIPWLTCPAEGLSLNPFPPSLHCEVNPIFLKTQYDLPYWGPVMLYPMQLHGLAYGLFASLVAPFGGFFASAIKRAYRKKDFDSFMPGHGGMMDRMDCQLIMTAFSSFYIYSFIVPRAYTVAKMTFLASQMTPENQLKLWTELGKLLGQLPATA